MMNTFAAEARPAPPVEVTLNELQEIGRDMILDLVKRTADQGKLGVLVGKGGTGKSTTIGAAEYALEQEFEVGCVMKLATTGKAASVIGGSTVHSRKNGIGLPVGRQKFRDLSSNMLKQAQKRFTN